MITRNFLPKEAATLSQAFLESHSTFLFTSYFSEVVTWQLLALTEARKCCLLARTGVLFYTKMEIGGNWKIQSLPWLYACIRFTVYYFIPYFTPCLRKYKIFTYWFPQNATFLSNLLWKSWLTALLVLRGVALVGLPGPAALFLTSMLCLISVFSEPAVFFLEGRDNSRTLFCSLSIQIISFLSESELKIAPWLCSILILPVAKGWVSGGSHCDLKWQQTVAHLCQVPFHAASDS